MKISHRNFMASQAFYGLCIRGSIPSDKEMDKYVEASYRVADKQINFARRRKQKKGKQ